MCVCACVRACVQNAVVDAKKKKRRDYGSRQDPVDKFIRSKRRECEVIYYFPLIVTNSFSSAILKVNCAYFRFELFRKSFAKIVIVLAVSLRVRIV